MKRKNSITFANLGQFIRKNQLNPHQEVNLCNLINKLNNFFKNINYKCVLVNKNREKLRELFNKMKRLLLRTKKY